ncbi:cobyrinate a,c-diamide synthase [Methanofollis aquaemaris]|uniref:Cobyrinate a,c-diamide synthase n=1 Tax=Methanofollis aquaemaris TaxID=126734 RepID=A0A8A3S7U5_9EURY|nr:cobyrinate a,c-diamide synthase [Methanofollis aquaemaris]QSZ68003.1 cobyrinate a,c-diamide synthase [Methanofollis aquaemaris]
MIPAIVIAGTHSGCGKTTLASGIMAALQARGLEVQPFKVGPDFIDPSHHTAICGRPSRNLDPFMMGEDGVVRTFRAASAGADIAVIEGVMGMYDGLEGGDLGSTAHVARILGAPVVLVVDVGGMSRSVHALVRGYTAYDPSVRFAGVIFNRVGSPRHRQMIEEELSVPALGWVPTEKEKAVSSRHLGLAMAGEASMAAFGEVCEAYCDLDALLVAAASGPAAVPIPGPAGAGAPSRVRLGVARDAAFCFYYQDNLDLLRRAGAELVYFSPLTDPFPEVDGLYLGGGYPELHAAALSAAPCTDQVRAAAEDGMPVYAECGGLIYLCEGLEADGQAYRMAGALPARAQMHGRFQALGYVEADATGASPLLPAGAGFRGHEFHYSSVDPAADARFGLSLRRGKGIADGRDGLCEYAVMAGYSHAYLNETFASAFVEAMERRQRSG